MKRFYKDVKAVPVKNGWQIHLDGKAVRTPSGHILDILDSGIAEKIAAEWRAQDGVIRPDTMPLMQIVITTQTHVCENRAEITRLTLAYLDTDLICYRAGAQAAVAKFQLKVWDPWVDWFFTRFGTKIATTEDLHALRQPEGAHRAVSTYVTSLNLWKFSVLQMVTAISGSLILAIAFVEKEISIENLIKAIYVEEDYRAIIYNEDFYGGDPLLEKVRQSKTADLVALRDILESGLCTPA